MCIPCLTTLWYTRVRAPRVPPRVRALVYPMAYYTLVATKMRAGSIYVMLVQTIWGTAAPRVFSPLLSSGTSRRTVYLVLVAPCPGIHIYLFYICVYKKPANKDHTNIYVYIYMYIYIYIFIFIYLHRYLIVISA